MNSEKKTFADYVPILDNSKLSDQVTTIARLSKVDIHAEFKKWLDMPIPDLGMSDDHEYLIADVFVISRESKIFDPAIGKNAKEELTYPIAKVWQCGKYFDLDREGNSRRKFEPGTLVRLRDYETMTLENVRHEIWEKNPYRNSNLQQMGSAPPKWWQKLWDAHGRRLFALDPFDRDMTNWRNSVFLFDSPNIVAPITDWKKLLRI